MTERGVVVVVTALASLFDVELFDVERYVVGLLDVKRFGSRHGRCGSRLWEGGGR